MNDESEQIAAIYEFYPRKVGKIAAIKAIKRAVTFLVHSEKIKPIEARRKLYRATVLYAQSPAGQNPDRTLIPHPATWYNRGSYLDDPAEWQHGGTNNAALPTGKANQNLAVLQRALDRRKRDGGSDQNGLLPSSGNG